MNDKLNPQVHLMVKEAVENLHGTIKYKQIKDYINAQWKGVNQNTIVAQIIAATVNHTSRHHYPENHKERKSDQGSPFDLLFWVKSGTAVKYDPDKHGIWELVKNQDGSFLNSKVGVDFFKSTYLFDWNPSKWDWKNLELKLQEFDTTGKTSEIWTCSSFKQVKIGDRAFLVKLGKKVKTKGLFASGYIMSLPFQAPSATDPTRMDWRVIIEFDVFVDPKDVIVTVEELKQVGLTSQNWLPQQSGISVQPDIAFKLEAIWLKNFFSIAANSTSGKKYIDGEVKHRLVKVYERSPYAREACLKEFGAVCAVCNLDFSVKYGGNDYIHVHHLNELHIINEAHEIDPVKDLVPICPNCHAMVHARKNPCFSIQEIKDKIQEQKKLNKDIM